MPFSSKFEIDQRRATIAKLYLQGLYQSQIAEKVNVTQQQVSADLKVMHEAWIAGAQDDIAEAKARELAKIDLLEAEAWDAWQRSKEPTIKRSQEKKNSQKKTRETLTQEDNIGDPRYLQQIERCVQARCQLMGLLDPSIQINNVNIHPKQWLGEE